jgi:hypothetical protein
LKLIRQMNAQNKKPRWRRDFYYLDGLVSTGT